MKYNIDFLLKENGKYLDIDSKTQKLILSINDFQTQKKYFDINEFQKISNTFSLDFIDNFLVNLQKQNLVKYDFNEYGIILNFSKLISIFYKMEDLIPLKNWDDNELRFWIKKNLKLSELKLEQEVSNIKENYSKFVIKYLKLDIQVKTTNLKESNIEIKSNFSSDLNDLAEENILDIETEEVSFWKHDLFSGVATKHHKIKSAKENENFLDNKKQTKLSQKSWFEE